MALLRRISRWNGSAWTAPSRPCVAPTIGATFGAPSLTVNGTRLVVVCGILTNAVAITGKRTLVALARCPPHPRDGRSWAEGRINSGIDLASDNDLAYVARFDPRGRPWVAWTAQGSAGPIVIVSTLVPPIAQP